MCEHCLAFSSPFFPKVRAYGGNPPDSPAGLAALHQEQEKRKRVLGWRRTHKDPFAGEWEQILSWLVVNPQRNSGDIFRELQCRSLGRYQPFLQRGMRKIRAYLLGTVQDGWQEEVIRGSSPSRVSAGCTNEKS